MASKLKIAGTAAAVLGIGALSIISPKLEEFEATVYVDYYDPLGIPTACRGHTGPDVKVGTKRSKAECDALETADVNRIWSGLTKCITNDEMTDHQKAAIVLWAFNVGIGAACDSTLIKYVNKGDMLHACYELPKWNQGGGKVMPGLTNRRAKELKICLGEDNGPHHSLPRVECRRVGSSPLVSPRDCRAWSRNWRWETVLGSRQVTK